MKERAYIEILLNILICFLSKYKMINFHQIGFIISFLFVFVLFCFVFLVFLIFKIIITAKNHGFLDIENDTIGIYLIYETKDLKFWGIIMYIRDYLVGSNFDYALFLLRFPLICFLFVHFLIL